MDMQTAIVTVIALISLVFLARQCLRTAKGSGGCGCGCGQDCPAETRRRCASEARGHALEKTGGAAE